MIIQLEQFDNSRSVNVNWKVKEVDLFNKQSKRIPLHFVHNFVYHYHIFYHFKKCFLSKKIKLYNKEDYNWNETLTTYYDESNQRSYIENLLEKGSQELRSIKYLIFYKYSYYDENAEQKVNEEMGKFLKAFNEKMRLISDENFEEISPGGNKNGFTLYMNKEMNDSLI